MLRIFQPRLRPKMIIDLGTSEIRIAVVGKERLHLPLPERCHNDLDMLSNYLRQQTANLLKLNPDLYFLIDPCDTVQHKASLMNIGQILGGNRSQFLSRPLCHLRSLQSIPWGALVADLGASHAVITLIQEGEALHCHRIRYGGRILDSRLVEYVRRNFNLNISLDTAEKLKKKYSLSSHITGMHTETGLQVSGLIFFQEMNEAWMSVLECWLDAIKQSLYQASFKLLECLKVEGIFITGGSAMLKGLDDYLTQALNISVTRLQPPLQSALVGAENWIHGFKSI